MPVAEATTMVCCELSINALMVVVVSAVCADTGEAVKKTAATSATAPMSERKRFMVVISPLCAEDADRALVAVEATEAQQHVEAVDHLALHRIEHLDVLNRDARFGILFLEGARLRVL